MIPLRPFQVEAINACRAAAEAGKRKFVLCLPTGAGKTITALTMVDSALARGNRCLFIAHREELIQQTASTFERVAPSKPPAGVVKAERNEKDAQFVIASAQTLWGIDRALEKRRRELKEALDEATERADEGGGDGADVFEAAEIEKELNRLSPKSYPRLDAINPESFAFVVVDEAHHATSDGFQEILKRFPASTVVLGLTATPYRGDGITLGDYFTDGIVYSYPLKRAMREGFLVDFRYRNVFLDIDLDRIRTRAGDYMPRELEAALEEADVAKRTVDAMLEHAYGRKSLVFTFSIAQAESTALELNLVGIPAKAISCDTRPDDRRKILDDFKKGVIRAVCSCGVLTEGFDEPSADCCVLARPTKSKTLYTQMLGRGLRINPGKEDCLVLDLCGSGSRNPPVTPQDLVGISPRNGESTAEAEARELKEAEERGLPRDVVAKAMLEAADKAAAVKKAFEAAWVVLKSPPRGVVEGRVVAGSKGRKVIIWTTQPESENGNRLWQVAVWMSAQENGSVFWLEQKGVALDFAQNIGRQAMMDMNQNVLMQSGSMWRLQPASKGQLEFAKKLSIAVDPLWSAGEVSNAVNSVICSRDLAKLLSGKQSQLFFETPESFRDALKRERAAVEAELEEWRGKRNEVSA